MGVFIKLKFHIHLEALDIHVKYEGTWTGMIQFYSVDCQHIPQLEHTELLLQSQAVNSQALLF